VPKVPSKIKHCGRRESRIRLTPKTPSIRNLSHFNFLSSRLMRLLILYFIPFFKYILLY
jgi:hypothetical protein